MKPLLTPEYQAQLQLKHATKPWGGGGASWVPTVAGMILAHRAQFSPPFMEHYRISVRDYGAGRRTFAPAMGWLMPHLELYEYDPGVPGIDTPPESVADFTICTDVMEHVEEQFVAETFKRIAALTRYAVLFNIALTPSKSLLPDGRNAHLTVKPARWWQEHVGKCFAEIEHCSQHKGYTIIARK